MGVEMKGWTGQEGRTIVKESQKGPTSHSVVSKKPLSLGEDSGKKGSLSPLQVLFKNSPEEQ